MKSLRIVIIEIIALLLISLLAFMNIVVISNDTKTINIAKISSTLEDEAYTGLTFDQKIGMNGFVDCKFDNLKAGGILREYHNFGWTYDANSGKCYFQSSWFDFDDFYKRVSEAGIEILPCIQQGNNKENREYKPVENGADTTKAASYKVHSNVLFNYAARYGSKEVETSRLNLTTNTEAKSGLGYIKYYENWNEPDKTWIGEKAHFSPSEFAAMCSADYDGHEGTLGNTYGIKQADPDAKLVYGGLAGGEAGVQYLEGMKQWAEENRTDKKLPFDVINFHQYCGTHSPENSSFKSSAQALIDWKNENAPYLEVWITEFGWDTNPASPRSAPTYDTQRDWIIREYLLTDRLGLSRATVYNGRDDGAPENTTQYATCGLTTGKGKEERKSSWYGVNTAKNTLKGFHFDSVVEESNSAYVYKYKNNNNEECYVFWSPTEDGSSLSNYELKIDNVKSLELVEMKDKEELGIRSNVSINNSIVKLNVTESPKFLKVALNKSEESSKEDPKDEDPNKNKDKEEDKNKDNKDEQKDNNENKNNQQEDNNNKQNENKNQNNNSDNTTNNTPKDTKQNTNNIQNNISKNNTTSKSSTTTKTTTPKAIKDATTANKVIPQTDGNNDWLLILIGILTINLVVFGIVLKKKRIL